MVLAKLLNTKRLLIAAALSASMPVAASATSQLLETVTYGSKSVTEANAAGAGNHINFDFTTDLSAATSIEKFVITLNVSGIGAPVESGYTTYPASPIGGIAADGSEEFNSDGDPTENWFAEIVGGGKDANNVPFGSNSAFWARIDPDQSPLMAFEFELSPSNDIGEAGSDRQDGIDNRAFLRSVNTDQVRLQFHERSGGLDEFELLSASVSVFGTPAAVPTPVPLPASGLLLLGAVGGIAAWKRRKSIA